MTATTAPHSTTGSTVLPSHFSHYTTDVLRDTWTIAKMQHVVRALAGRRVVMVADARTGFTLVNVVLESVGRSMSANNGHVVVRSDYSDGTSHRTAYRLDGLTGCAIVDIENDGALTGVRHEATRTYEDLARVAIAYAQSTYAEGRCWGRWAASPVGEYGDVDVTYTPHTGNPAAAERAGGAGERGYWRVNPQAIADASAAKIAEALATL